MKLLFDLPDFDAQFLRAISYTYYGGADIGECFTLAKQIKEGDFESWHKAWFDAAQRIEQQGDQSLKFKHLVSARESYLRSSNYYRAATFFLYGAPVDPRLIETYDEHLQTFNKALSLFQFPAERVKIPFENGYLPGCFYKPDRSDAPRLTIIANNGYDGTQQEFYFITASAALRRGYNVLTFDGPGQGECLIKQHMPMRSDWEKVVSSVVDYILGRADVIPENLTLAGESWGALLATRAAIYEKRIAALIVNPGQIDATYPLKKFYPGMLELLDHKERPALEEFIQMIMGNKMMAEKFRAKLWIHGLSEPLDLLKEWCKYNLTDTVKEITCPTLVAFAENEPLTGDQALQLYNALTCPKEYVPFYSNEGAGEHCCAGARSLFHQRAFDWLDGLFGIK